jgi:carbamoylphosphate synthase large subunit
VRILVTGIGGPAGRHVSELLLHFGHTVLGADMQQVDVPGIAAFYRSPAAQAPGYLTWLAETSASADLIIPTVQEELPVVAAGVTKIACPVLIPSAASVALAHDKYLTAQALDAARVPTPRFSLPPALQTAAHVTEQIGWPCLSKPRVGRGGRRVTVYDTPEAFADLTLLDGAYIVQEFAPGVEYNANLFLGEWGEESIVILEKLEVREERTGNATRVRCVDAPVVARTAVAAARALGLTGPLDMDIRCRADGTPLVLEINARFGANITYAPEVLTSALPVQ